MYSFPNFEPVCCSCLVLIVASWLAYRFLRMQVRWWYYDLFKNFPLFVMIYTIKGFSVLNEVEVFFFFFSWNSLAYFIIQQMLAFFSLAPLPFLNPSCVSEISWFTLLDPSLRYFEHYLASMWSEHDCVIVLTFFSISFLWDWNEK